MSGQHGEQPPAAPFALVVLETLSVKRFEHKDDFLTATERLRADNRLFVPLRYHAGIGSYVVPEWSEF